MYRPGMIDYCSVCPSLSSHSQSCQCLQLMQMGNLWMPRLNHSYVCSGLTGVAIWVAWTLWDRSMLCINSWGYSEQVSVTQVRHYNMLPPAIICDKRESWRHAPLFSANRSRLWEDRQLLLLLLPVCLCCINFGIRPLGGEFGLRQNIVVVYFSDTSDIRSSHIAQNFIIPLNAFFLGLSFLFGAAASNYFEVCFVSPFHLCVHFLSYADLIAPYQFALLLLYST